MKRLVQELNNAHVVIKSQLTNLAIGGLIEADRYGVHRADHPASEKELWALEGEMRDFIMKGLDL